jgi:hypothetical protein
MCAVIVPVRASPVDEDAHIGGFGALVRRHGEMELPPSTRHKGVSQMHSPQGRLMALVAIATLAVSSSLAHAQPLELEAEAIAGEPFGVARLSMELPPGMAARENFVGLPLAEKDERIFYPAFDERPVRGLLRNLLNRPEKVTAYFLFRGQEPLQISIAGEAPADGIVLRPISDPVAHRQMLDDWWEAYTEDRLLARLFGSTETPPPQVKNYLQAMLSRRLGLRLPGEQNRPAAEVLNDPLGLMLGTEEVRLALQREGFLARDISVEVADQPLPQPITLPSDDVPQPPVNVEIEPLAMHVPEECFYVRFGNYANFQWLRAFLSSAGGDMRNLVTVRGVSYGVSSGLERQLVLKSSLLGDLFGGVAISDVAIVGADTFVREGAAIGVLFQAANTALLRNNLTQQRQALLAADQSVKEEQIEIAGQQVSLLATADHSVRSFYVIDGDFHFVTTSRALAERFLQAGKGTRPLGATRQFALTRASLPVSRQHTIFAYLSAPFLQNLISPQYRLEMTRRLQASGDLELAYLARLAARGEGKPHAAIDELVAGGFLPPQFGRRPDGSRTIIDGETIYDSLRGGRGSFLPVPDVQIEAATVSESNAYQALGQYTHSKVQNLQPVVAAVHRQVRPDNPIERVTIDVRLSPFADSQFQFLTDWLHGPPDTKRLVPVPGDLVQIEAALGGKHTFAGLRDCNPARLFLGSGGRLGTLLNSLTGLPWDNLVGYIGTAGDDPTFGFFGPPEFGPPDAQGYSRSAGPAWRRDFGQFAVLSFQPRVLEVVTPQLQFEPAKRAAHGRIRAVDLRGTQLHEMLDMLAQRRAEATTRGNLQFINSLAQQLHLPPKECLPAAKRILDAKFVSPLGGEYVLNDRGGPNGWTWTPPKPEANTASRPPFENPLLRWFRGLDGDILLEGRSLLAHFEIDMDSSRLVGAKQANGLTSALDFLKSKTASPSASEPAPVDSSPKPQ